jgi:hypothetical protein
MSAGMPFEDGQDTIRDLTTLGAKRMIALIRRISRGELDGAQVRAREVIQDVKRRQQQRRRALRAARRLLP